MRIFKLQYFLEKDYVNLTLIDSCYGYIRSTFFTVNECNPTEKKKISFLGKFLERFEHTNLRSISHFLDIPHHIYSKILPLYHNMSPIYGNCPC